MQDISKMDDSQITSSTEKSNKELNSQGNISSIDNGHTDEIEACWKIDEEGKKEENDNNEECTIIEVKTKESRHVINTPNYKSEFTGFLTEKEFSIETGKHIKNDCVPKRTCFNCLGDHNINECKEKKDYQAIARNKATILGKKTSNIRYHEDGENKFSNFLPGVLSDNLINALGLKHSQPPEFIYRMRILGYPPGWLKEAEVKRSTVSLIDGSGKTISHPDDEEGETDVCVTKYQPEKFISFPGFNVPFQDHMKDEYKLLQYPPMQYHHKRENFIKFMKLNKADLSKRKKLKETLSSDTSTPLPTRSDMDVDEAAATDTLIELSESAAELKSKEDGEISSDSSNCKTNFELESNSVESPSVTSTDVSKSLKRSVEGESSDSSAPSSRVKRHHRSLSKGFNLGVCIPGSITPFKELPDASKWSVDVSDHILFDNLPDSLGTWQKMKGIVKNVQNKLQELGAAQNDT